jgi:hypothetical protein
MGVLFSIKLLTVIVDSFPESDFFIVYKEYYFFGNAFFLKERFFIKFKIVF